MKAGECIRLTVDSHEIFTGIITIIAAGPVGE